MQYKNIPICKIPSDWDFKSLIEVGELGDGDWILKENYTEGGVRLLQIGDIGNGKFIDKSNRHISVKRAQELKCTFIDSENEILISRLPNPVGRACLAPNLGKPYIVAVDVSIFKPNTSIISKEYALYVLNSKSHLNNVKKYLVGTTRARISRKKLEKIKIPIPPLKTQQKIVEILEKAEKLKQWRAEADVLTDEYLKSVFLDMFGDPVKNPKGWEIKTIEGLSSEIVDCPHSTPKYSENITEFPCIRTTELKNGYIDWSQMKYLNENEYEKRVKRLVPVNGDVVYGREGTFGEAVRVPENTKMSLGQRVMLFRPNKDICNSTFLWALLRSDGIYAQAVKKTSGSTVGHVNIKDIKKFKAVCPPLELQNQFAETVQKVEQLKNHQKQSKQQIDNLFNTLMQKAFKGELTC